MSLKQTDCPNFLLDQSRRHFVRSQITTAAYLRHTISEQGTKELATVEFASHPNDQPSQKSTCEK